MNKTRLWSIDAIVMTVFMTVFMTSFVKVRESTVATSRHLRVYFFRQ